MLKNRIIILETIEDIESKLIPIFNLEEENRYPTYIVNMTIEVLNYLMEWYHKSPDLHPDLVKFVKSLRQRECYKDGNAWSKVQQLDLILDSLTGEALQIKLGKPTDLEMNVSDCNIDDGQTRSTHYTSFFSGDKYYEFDVKLLRDRLENDRNNNLNSLSQIKDELWKLLEWMENQKNPPKFNYNLLKNSQFKTLRENFDSVIISAKLSFKPEAYLVKSFINDNRTTTTLQNDQVLIARGTVLPSVENSWTHHIRPEIDKWNGRVGSDNMANPMVNGSFRTAKNFAKKAWRLTGKPDTGQVTSFNMNITLGFQKDGLINLKKKLWENDNKEYEESSWRQLVHTSDTSDSSAHNTFVIKCFKESKLHSMKDRKKYLDKTITVLQNISDITYTIVSDKEILESLSSWGNMWSGWRAGRLSDKDKHPTLNCFNLFNFNSTENAHLLVHELIRISNTYGIPIDNEFVKTYLDKLMESLTSIYSTEKKINEIGSMKSTKKDGSYATTYEARLPYWVELFEKAEDLMNDSVFEFHMNHTNDVSDKDRFNQVQVFEAAYDINGIFMNGRLYTDPEWDEDVTRKNFHVGHTTSNKNHGSADVKYSVAISPTRNSIAGAKTKGETQLPEPAVFYNSLANSSYQKMNQTKDKKLKAKYRNDYYVLTTISEWYEENKIEEILRTK